MKQRIQGMVIGALVTFVLGSLIFPAIAAANYRQIAALYDDIKVVVNGELLDKNDLAYREPFMVGGVTSWDDATKTLYLGSINANRTYKLSELEHSYLGGTLRYADEARDSTDTFRKDCLMCDARTWIWNQYVDYTTKSRLCTDAALFDAYKERAVFALHSIAERAKGLGT